MRDPSMKVDLNCGNMIKGGKEKLVTWGINMEPKE
jgi:hypothetical protein